MRKKAEKRFFRVSDGISVTAPHLAGRGALREASADDLRVLVCLLEYGGAASASLLSDAAGCSEGRANAALEYWVNAGILEETESVGHQPNEAKPENEKDEQPKLRRAFELAPASGEETAEIVERRKLSGLIAETQGIYGKVFNSTEIATVAGLAEQLELDEAYLVTLFSWCVNKGKKSLRYAEKTAFSLYEEGIDTIETLEAYILKKETAASGIGQLRRMFGIGDRALTRREDDCFTKWLTDFAFTVDMIGIAYDITVNSSGKASVAYADKIITKWHTAGCTSEKEIEDLIEREKKTPMVKVQKEQPVKEKASQGSFDTDEFFARALARSYGSTTKKGD